MIMIQCRFMNFTYKQVQNNSLAITDIIFKMTIFKIVCKRIENKSFRSFNDTKKNRNHMTTLIFFSNTYYTQENEHNKCYSIT